MISHTNLSELLDQDCIKMLGFTPEYFYSLPIHCQNEIMVRLFKNNFILKKDQNFRVKKEKILSLFKNRK